MTDAEFQTWCAELDTHSAAVLEVTATDDPAIHGYQNTVFLLQDQYGDHVGDCFLEFYVDDDAAGWFAGMFHSDATRSVHTYGDDRAYRSVYVDCTTLVSGRHKACPYGLMSSFRGSSDSVRYVYEAFSSDSEAAR